MYQLNTPLHQVRGIGPALSSELSAAGLHVVQDLLLAVPIRYEDRSQILSIAELLNRSPDLQSPVTLVGQIDKVSNFYRGHRSQQSAWLTDPTGRIKLAWFNSPFVVRGIKSGLTYAVSGKYQPEYRNLTQPTLEAIRPVQLHTGRIVPLYSSTLPMGSGRLRRWLHEILANLSLTDAVPIQPNLVHSLEQLHFPDSESAVVAARERLALEELLVLMREAARRKVAWRQQNQAICQIAKTDALALEKAAKLPFRLTPSQNQVLTEILTDLTQSQPMNRLLLGDVGAGKTVVAALAGQAILSAGYSVALVAPTRLLAQQHFESLQQLFPQLGLKLVLGGQTRSKKPHAQTQPTLIIGTHALLNQLTSLKPGLVIVDEQQRFGVTQRSLVSDQKGRRFVPHQLTMTATPIPRSLSLTIFAHLAVSRLSGKLPGRQAVTTWLISEKKRTAAFDWLSKHLAEQPGRLALCVCPFIDPSAALALENVQAVSSYALQLREWLPQHLRLGILHGRLSKAAQQEVRRRAYAGELDVIVATPMVEVGIDLPQATAIVIESAERFGLASLHQLRGRVGRRDQAGFCLLFRTSAANLGQKTPTTNDRQRLQAFCQENDGSVLAEIDLKFRGAGDIFGTRQHGFATSRFFSWTDHELIAQAQQLDQNLPKNWQSPLDLLANPAAEIAVAAN